MRVLKVVKMEGDGLENKLRVCSIQGFFLEIGIFFIVWKNNYYCLDLNQLLKINIVYYCKMQNFLNM